MDYLKDLHDKILGCGMESYYSAIGFSLAQDEMGVRDCLDS